MSAATGGAGRWRGAGQSDATPGCPNHVLPCYGVAGRPENAPDTAPPGVDSGVRLLLQPPHVRPGRREAQASGRRDPREHGAEIFDASVQSLVWPILRLAVEEIRFADIAQALLMDAGKWNPDREIPEAR